MNTPIADDFAAIKEALERLEADKKPAEEPKAWPNYAAAETAPSEYWPSMYLAPDSDPA